ncbi:MAG: ubiquinone/menaquinone biosynthesis methyltransferase [Candidatus Eiseniibacteriota bacterium]
MPDAPPPGVPELETQDDDAGRFAPHAGREMARMFDQVSGRYQLLNRLMTLGRDGAWRAAMWRAVPLEARVVLDLCTGDGASLGGLRRPGRLVIGADVSRAMLEQAQARHGTAGWAPRLVVADAFRLPLRTHSVDAATAAFGMRNLRPRGDALAELARVIQPGGVLAVLEAAAPRPGWFAPFHRFHLKHVIPLAGHLSDDASAYRYLSRSIFEFGSGAEFEAELAAAGFELIARQSFMLGATRLWVGRRGGVAGQTSAAPTTVEGGERRSTAAGGESPAASAPSVQNASRGALWRSELPQESAGWGPGPRAWRIAQAMVSAAILAALIVAAWVYWRTLPDLSLPLWQRRGSIVLLASGVVLFGLRTLVLTLRAVGPPER